MRRLPEATEARRHFDAGRVIKREFGPRMFRTADLLAKLRFQRGTALNNFGYAAECSLERQLADYKNKTMWTAT